MNRRFLLLALAGSLLLPLSLSAQSLYGLLLQGYTWPDAEVQKLLNEGADPGEALRTFLLTDYSGLLRERSYLLSDDPHLVVDQLLILMDRAGESPGDYQDLLPAAAANPGFYPLERLKILRSLATAQSGTAELPLAEAREVTAARFRQWLQTGEGKSLRSSYLYLSDLVAPPEEIDFVQKSIPFIDTDTGILNGQNQIYQILADWNKGITRTPPPDWFRREGRFQGLMISYTLPLFLNPQGRALAAELLTPLVEGELTPFNREFLELSLAGLREPPPPTEPEIVTGPVGKRDLVPPFLSFLKRRFLSGELSLLLPDLPWEEVPPSSTGFTKTLAFSNGGGIKGAYYREELLPADYNLRKDPRTWNSLLNLPVPPDHEGERRPLYNRMPMVVSGRAAMGDLPVDRVYFQPFFSHGDGQPDGRDMAVEARLYIQTGPRWITLGLFSLMNGKDPRVNAEYLMGECLALLKSARMSIPPRKEPELQKAFEEGNVEAIITSLESGKNPNGVDSGGEPLWHRLFSLESGEERERLLTAFLSAGVNPNSSDSEGSRALEKAQDRFDWASIKLLLENGASGEPAGPGSVPPLVRAALDGDLRTASLLLDHQKIYPDFTDRFGRTALHWAAQGGWTEIVSRLLQSHADPDMKDAFGYTPFHWAVMENNSDILLMLKEAGAEISTPHENSDPVSLALSGGAFETARQLVDNGLPVPPRWAEVMEAWNRDDAAEAWLLWGQIKRQASVR